MTVWKLADWRIEHGYANVKRGGFLFVLFNFNTNVDNSVQRFYDIFRLKLLNRTFDWVFRIDLQAKLPIEMADVKVAFNHFEINNST